MIVVDGISLITMSIARTELKFCRGKKRYE